MDTLWETLRQFASTLGTLAKAQVILVPLIASWVFTGVWVYATEHKRGSGVRPGRALLGLFWLPGLLVYYLFPGQDPAPQPHKESFTFGRTPKTVLAPRSPRTQAMTETTSDGVNTRATQSRSWHSDSETDDGSGHKSSARGGQKPASSAPPPFFLEVLTGKLKGKPLHPPAGLTKIGVGRAINAHIRLEDPTIAPWHVYIEYEETGDWTLRVVDYAARKSSTQVNGRTATVIPLRHRDEIRLGDVLLRFNCS